MTIDAVLVDTDVVSFLLKDDTRAQAYRPLLTNKTLVPHTTDKILPGLRD
jgi:hypothetical protein